MKKRKTETSAATLDRLKAEKQKTDKADQELAQTKGSEAVRKVKKQREANEEKLKQVLEREKKEYVSLPRGGIGPAGGERVKPGSKAKKEEEPPKVTKPEEDETKKTKSGWGHKLTRVLFGSNIANALKEERTQASVAPSPPGPATMATKGPGWELAPEGIAQQTLADSAKNAQALAQRTRP